MDIEKFTERSKGFIQAAQGMALRRGHQRLMPEHLLKTLLDDKEGLAANLIRSAGGQPELALAAVESALDKLPKVEGGGAGQVYLGPELARVLDTAEEQARKSQDSFVAVERMLVALAIGGSAALKSAGVTPASLNRAIEDLRRGRPATASSFRSSAATRKSAVPAGCCRAGARTIRC